jgi:hypothetical protein
MVAVCADTYRLPALAMWYAVSWIVYNPDTAAAAEHHQARRGRTHAIERRGSPRVHHVTLGELVRMLRAHWVRLILGLVAGGVVGGAVASVLPSYYRAGVVLAPASDVTESSGSLGSLASRFGGLASLAGVNLGGAATDRSAVTLETLRGHTFLVDFAKRRGLVVPLFAGRSRDPTTGVWNIDPEVYDMTNKKWVRRGWSGSSRNPEPSDIEIYRKLSKRLYVDEDRRSGMFRVAMESRSPTASAEWVSLLVADLNDYLRRKDVAEARKTIGYLEQQIRGTKVLEMQGIFFRLIEEQTKTLMLAQVRDEYALKIVDAPIVPDTPAQPNKILMVALAALAGFALAALSVLAFDRPARAPTA